MNIVNSVFSRRS